MLSELLTKVNWNQFSYVSNSSGIMALNYFRLILIGIYSMFWQCIQLFYNEVIMSLPFQMFLGGGGGRGFMNTPTKEKIQIILLFSFSFLCSVCKILLYNSYQNTKYYLWYLDIYFLDISKIGKRQLKNRGIDELPLKYLFL